ncbi:hypothetical protein QBK99_19175 [Corticibacterium sp. UT-5YL-CI-8]|nr:hypothetical protein [Tianweitania sp. UT-5YL-CI-8]
MSPKEALDWYHRTAVKLFEIHATNKMAKHLGLPGLPGDIEAANRLMVYFERVHSAQRSANAVKRCRSARRPLRAKTKVHI